MDCPDAEELAALLAHALDPARRATIADHAAGCASCHAMIAELATDMQTVLSRPSSPDTPDDARPMRRALLEALASGLPIAAFPVTGPKDVVADHPIGVLSEDLRAACLGALDLSRDACRAFALNYSWENSARQFIGHLQKLAEGRAARGISSTAPAYG